MKVLFLTQIPSPYKMDFFAGLGHYTDLTVLFERASAGNRDSEWLRKKPKNFSAVFLKGKLVGDEMAFCPNVIKYVLDRDYDRIVIGQYSSPTAMLAILIMKMLRIKYYISTDGGMVKNEKGLKRAIKSFFMKNAEGYFSPSTSSDQFLMFYGADKLKIHRYPFSSVHKSDVLKAPVSLEDKVDLRKKLRIEEEKVIISVGQFIYRKGFDVLLNTAAHLPQNIGIYIIGGEPTKEYIELIKKYNLKTVHFLKFMEKEQLKEYYMASDLFVLPTREDIWGLVINEALCYGLPIVTTNQCNAGIELITDSRAGTIIPSDNVEATKIAILKEMQEIENDKSKQKSKKTLKIAAENTIDNMVLKYKEVLGI